MSEKENGNAHFTVRCSEAEAKLIREQAALTHRTVSQFMCHATLMYIQARQGNGSPFVHKPQYAHK